MAKDVMRHSKKIEGILQGRSKAGEPVYTIFYSEDFGDYDNNPENGRFCKGRKTGEIYAHTYDCSNLEAGMEIEVFYEKAILFNGKPVQSVAFINILSK